jgi:hypothetical protein
MPMRGELPSPATAIHASKIKNRKSWLMELFTNQDLIAVLLFSGIGLLLAIDLMLRFPMFWETDFGSLYFGVG